MKICVNHMNCPKRGLLKTLIQVMRGSKYMFIHIYVVMLSYSKLHV